MLEILISSTVLILALAALRFLLRGKISPRLQYALWLLAALRLLLPVSLVRSPVSVMNAVPDVPAAVQRLTAPEDRRAPQTDSTQAPAQTTSEPETAPVEVQTRLTASTILKFVWLTGAAAMALVVLAQNLRFLRRLKRIRQPFACPKSPVPVSYTHLAGLLLRRRAVPVGAVRGAAGGRSACSSKTAHRRDDGRSGAAVLDV